MNIFSFKYMIALPSALGIGCSQIYKEVQNDITANEFVSIK